MRAGTAVVSGILVATAIAAGSLVADVVIPDFTQGKLALSGLSLASRQLPASLSYRAGAVLAPVSSPPPTTSRDFDASETIDVFAEVYDNIRKPAAHTVDITLTLRTDDGRVLQTRTEARSSDELRRASGAYGFRAQLPLAGIAPGLYVVRLHAQANAGARPDVSRDVQIRIR